jgi:hypothetical protein
MNRDESLEEIWAVRRAISRQFGHDPKTQVAHYRRKQKQLEAKLYRREAHLEPAR